MKGTKRLRASGRWELRVYVGKHPVSGHPRQISRAFQGTASQADRALRDLIREVESEQVTAKPVLEPAHSVTALFDRFFLMKPLAGSTAKTYRSYVNLHILPAIGHLHVTEVTLAGLNEFYNYLTVIDGLSPATVRQAHAIISSAFRFGRKEGFGGLTVAVNPCYEATLPALEYSQIIPPSAAQVHRLLDPAVHFDQRFLLACRLAAATGARRGEICGLRWHDLSGNRRLRIDRAVWDPGHGQPIVIKTTKGRQGRSLTLDEDTWNKLTEIRLDPTLGPKDFIISGGPEPCSPETIGDNWAALCRRVGITGVRFHDLRHFHATELVRSGEMSIADVSRRLGHAKASTTWNIYAHAVLEDDEKAAEVIRRVLKVGPSSFEASEPVRITPPSGVPSVGP